MTDPQPIVFDPHVGIAISALLMSAVPLAFLFISMLNDWWRASRKPGRWW